VTWFTYRRILQLRRIGADLETYDALAKPLRWGFSKSPKFFGFWPARSLTSEKVRMTRWYQPHGVNSVTYRMNRP
jgi:hypothetical protein